MARLVGRRTEERTVGIYALLAGASIVLALLVLQIDAPYVGIFVVFWLVVLCGLAAVTTALVVLFVNARRATHHTPLDTWAVAFAAMIPLSLGAAVTVVLMEASPQLFVASILVALVVAPLGLLVTIFGASARRLVASNER